MVLLFTACKNKETQNQTTSVPANAIESSKPEISNNTPYWITLDSIGGITFNNKKMDIDQLQKELTDTLSKIKKSGAPMPDTILFKTEGTVLMGMRGAVHDVIEEVCDSMIKKR